VIKVHEKKENNKLDENDIENEKEEIMVKRKTRRKPSKGVRRVRIKLKKPRKKRR